MPNKISPFNPFDYMDTQDEINNFLRECLEDNDPNIFVSAMRHLVKSHGVTNVKLVTV